ncbi:hypothetical protein [Nocardia testacea]|uniref:Uncharacterized protein n=1 Tax=Nocardia testacea TaxID=248551 RepID=A0ABW7W7I2_9NOCA
MWHGVRCTELAATEEGFRYTPGWGSLASICVGLVAVLAASYWNYRTLTRVEERYQADLREAHADKVRDSIMEVVHQTTLWAYAFKDYRSLVTRELAAVSSQEQATAAEMRIREKANLHVHAHNELRRALWSAQLVVDDTFVRDSLVDCIELLGIRDPETKIEWKDLGTVLDRRHENRVKVNEKIDAVLDYALEHMCKDVPAPIHQRRSLWRRTKSSR